MKKHILILSIFLLANCSKQSDSTLSYVPDNIGAMFSINIGKILEKIKYNNILDSDMGEDLLKELEDAPSLVKKIIKDPSETGLDLNKSVYFFSEGLNKTRGGRNPTPQNFGLVISILDIEKFKGRFEMMLDLLPGDVFGDQKKNEKYQYVSADIDGIKMTFGFNNDVFLLYAHLIVTDQGSSKNWTEDIEVVLNGELKNMTLIEKPGIEGILLDDLALWLNLTSIGNAIDLFPRELSGVAEKENFSNNYVTSSINFNLGELSLNLEAYFNEKISTVYDKNLFNKKIGDDIINRFPDDPLAGLGFALDLESYITFAKTAFKKVFKNEYRSVRDLETDIGITLEEIGTVLSGNVFAALYDIEYGRYGPEDMIASAAIGVKDKKQFDDLLKKLIKYDEFPRELRSYAYDFIDGEVIQERGMPFVLFMDDNYIYITHPDNKSDLKRGNKESQLKNGLSSKVSESNFYLFAYPYKMIKGIPDDYMGREENMIKDTFLDLRLGLVDLGVEYGENSISTTLNIKSKDSEENMLYSFYEAFEQSIIRPIYLNYVKSSYASEARTVISNINNAAKMYYQTKGDWPSDIEELERSGQLEVSRSTKLKWSFDLQLDDWGGSITATSTETMAGGAGHQVMYNGYYGSFSGYGSERKNLY